MLEQKEIIARTVEDFANVAYTITGTELNNKQARMLMAAAITSPMRSLFAIADEQGVPVNDVTVSLPYGKIEVVASEAKTGAVGEEKKALLDENGNPVMKNRLKIRLSKGISEEVLSKTGWVDEEIVKNVSERLAKEEKALNEYEEVNKINETWLASEELRDIIMPSIVKYLRDRFNIDLDEELASFEIEDEDATETDENQEVEGDTAVEQSDENPEVVEEKEEPVDPIVEEDEIEKAVDEDINEDDF